VFAGAAGGILGGVPSTVSALVRGDDPLEATLAAASMLLPDEERTARLLAAAVPVHFGISIVWSIVLERVLPRRHRIRWGVAAGVGIAALDLFVVGRRFERIRKLPLAPQLADHVVYGATVGYVLSR
jgi:hypothetical protein